MQKELSEVAEIYTGFTLRNAVLPRTGKTFLVQAKNIQSFYFTDFDGCTSITIEGERTNAFLQKGDVLMSSRGEYRTAVYESTEKNVIASSTILIIRIKNPLLTPAYLAIFLTLPETKKNLRKLTSGGAIESITKKDLLQIPIPILPLEQQQRIIDIYSLYEQRQELLAKKMTLESQLFDTILQSYFSF